MALTIERYVAIVYPIRHRVSFSGTKVKLSLVAVWLAGALIQFPLKVTTGYIKHGRCHVLQGWVNRTVSTIVFFRGTLISI